MSSHQSVDSLPRVGRKRFGSVRYVNKMDMPTTVHKKHRRRHHESVRSADSGEEVSGSSQGSLKVAHSTDQIGASMRWASSGDIDVRCKSRDMPRHNSILSEPSLIPESIPDFSLSDQLIKLSKLFSSDKSEDRLCPLCSSKCRDKFYFLGGYYYHAKCVKCSRCKNPIDPPFKVIDSKTLLCANCIEKALETTTERSSLLVEKEEKRRSSKRPSRHKSSNADSE